MHDSIMAFVCNYPPWIPLFRFVERSCLVHTSSVLCDQYQAMLVVDMRNIQNVLKFMIALHPFFMFSIIILGDFPVLPVLKIVLLIAERVLFFLEYVFFFFHVNQSSFQEYFFFLFKANAFVSAKIFVNLLIL